MISLKVIIIIFRRNSLDICVLETQQSSIDWLYLKNITKQEEEDKKEISMTLIIISILVMYFICTFPAAIIVQIDPDTKKFPQVCFLYHE